VNEAAEEEIDDERMTQLRDRLSGPADTCRPGKVCQSIWDS